ncbi:hypothetical protein MAPG_04056 [Magnaporthiopsis poae ATCC 64411]|uniref:DUF7708 domain-containing protein n=1 Tax=Magnaporthiopsis poae (strain ATCC 64411 / 73-15) TaxID=644358 RepID=A0A0C4DVP7_MAGP6|nr:hypothetical protein MAPG_04056 [Magnaporthiopsis poae ATCC 64411]
MSGGDETAVGEPAQVAPARWFGDESPLLPKLQEIEQTHPAFCASVQSIVSMGEIASDQRHLLDKIKDPVDTEVPQRQQAERHLRQLSVLRKAHAKKRQNGCRKAGALVQKQLSSLGEFVEKYGGIIEMVFGAGGPYGTIAFQTLSILLSVMVRKVRNDTSVGEIFDQLSKSLPRLKTWEFIYPNESMGKLVAKAYVQVIIFSRQATEYLTSSWTRFLRAVMPIRSTPFDGITSEIQGTLAEINGEAMYRLHERIHQSWKSTDKIQESTGKIQESTGKIQDTVTVSAKHIEELKARAETAEIQNTQLLEKNVEAELALQSLAAQNRRLNELLEESRRRAEERDREDDARRLKDFEGLLGLSPPYGSGSSVANVRGALQQVFPDLPYSPRTTPSTSYVRAHPGLVAEYAASPASTAGGGTTTPAFFSCLPELDEPGCGAAEAIASVILQIVSARPELLRRGEHDFQTALGMKDREGRRTPGNNGKDGWRTSPINKKEQEPAKWPLESLLDLLQAVLQSYASALDGQPATLYVVLDRLDCCEQEDTVADALDRLAGMVDVLNRSRGPLCVKLLVVVETSQWRGTWHKRLRMKPAGHDLDNILIFNEDQRKLTTAQAREKEKPKTWGLGIDLGGPRVGEI